MRQQFNAVATALAVLACAGLAALWARSYWCYDRAGVRIDEPPPPTAIAFRRVVFESHAGVLGLSYRVEHVDLHDHAHAAQHATRDVSQGETARARRQIGFYVNRWMSANSYSTLQGRQAPRAESWTTFEGLDDLVRQFHGPGDNVFMRKAIDQPFGLQGSLRRWNSFAVVWFRATPDAHMSDVVIRHQSYYGVIVPHWVLVLVTAVGPALRLRATLRKRTRARRGLCVACGYDLRASRGKCPECGAQSSTANGE